MFEQNPVTPEADTIIYSATPSAVSTGNLTFMPSCLIFGQFGNVVAALTDDKKLMPIWNKVACESREMPLTIDATELPTYAPLMTHMGVNE